MHKHGVQLASSPGPYLHGRRPGDEAKLHQYMVCHGGGGGGQRLQL